MDSLGKKIEACFGEIKGIINSSTSNQSKVKSTTNRMSSSMCSDTIESSSIDWKSILLRLFDEVRKIEESNSDQLAVDSVLVLIVALRDCLKSCLQSSALSSSLISDSDLKSLVDLSEDFESVSVTNYSLTLTQDNVEINEIWESLWHSIKSLIVDRLVDNSLESLLDREIFYQEMALIATMREESTINLFNFYNFIRTQRINKLLNQSSDLGTIIGQVQKWITYDIELVDCYHLFTNQVTFNQIVSPYIMFIAQQVQNRLANHSNDLESMTKTIKLLRHFDDFLTERDLTSSQNNHLSLPSMPSTPSSFQAISDNWDWRSYFVSQGLDNCLLRYLNQGLNELIAADDLTEYLKIDIPLSSTSLTLSSSLSDDENILEPFRKIFTFLDSFTLIDITGFQSSFRVIVNVTVIDFLLKTATFWLKDNNLPNNESVYLVYNSFLYAQHKLDSYGLNQCKTNDVLLNLRSEIVSRHLSPLMFTFQSFNYILIYMKKLQIDLLTLIPYEKQDESHLFITLLRFVMLHVIKIELIDPQDALLLCSNIVDLLIPFAVNLEQLFYTQFQDIHSCCWILLLKLTCNHAPISALNSIVPKDIDLSITVPTTKVTTPTTKTAKSLAINKTTEILSSRSSIHWSNLFDICIQSLPRPSNALLVSLQQNRPISSTVIIRPFLESRLSFSINLFNQISVNPDNEKQVILLLYNVIKIASLNESQEKSVSYLLSSIIQRNEEWLWLDCSKIQSSPKPWWLQALNLIIDEIVFEFIQAIMTPLVYRYQLRISNYKSFYEETGIIERYLEFDETFLIEEATKSLLSSIITIIEIMPITLIASFEELKNYKLITIKTLFNSLTAQMIFSSFLRSCSESKLITKSNNDATVFMDKLLNKLETIIRKKEKLTIMSKSIASIIERRLSSKTNYVVASEADQFNLIGLTIDKDPDYQSIVDSLYNFLLSNRAALCKAGSHYNYHHHNQNNEIEFNFEPIPSEIKLTFDILKHFKTIRCPTIESISEDKWLQLTNHVSSKLSTLSIGHILSKRSDLLHDDEETSNEIRKFFNIN